MSQIFNYFPKDRDEIHFNRYIKFIESRSIRKKSNKVYTEMHHILPRSMNGNDDIDNLIRLTAREHYIAHLILYKAFGGKMTQAFWFMTITKQDKKLTSKQYSSLRNEAAKRASDRIKGEKNPNYNKPSFFKGHLFSEKSKQKLSKSNSDRIVINKDLKTKKVKKDELDKYLSQDWKIGQDADYIANVTKARIGIKMPYSLKIKASNLRKSGYYITNEDKTIERFIPKTEHPPKRWKKGRKKFTQEHIDKIAKSSKNRNLNKIIINNSVNEKRIDKENLEKYVKLGWKKGRKLSSNKGRVWINKDSVKKMIKKEDLDEYLNTGWHLGMNRKQKDA